MTTRRVLFKVGSSTVCHPGGGVNLRSVELLARALTDIKNSGIEIILVTSGAIGTGVGKLNLDERPIDIRAKQAVAAVGQLELMHIYDKLFGEYGSTIGQILLTRADIYDPASAENLRGTFDSLINMGVIPIVNENDSVAYEEVTMLHTFGDNDSLSAAVAALVGADRLVLISDIDGLYDSDPRSNPDARLIPVVYAITPEIEALAGGVGSALGTGGMATKLEAARLVAEEGIETVIINGNDPANIYASVTENPTGTLFRRLANNGPALKTLIN